MVGSFKLRAELGWPIFLHFKKRKTNKCLLERMKQIKWLDYLLPIYCYTCDVKGKKQTNQKA